jgi:hypothetical protein
LREQTGGFAFGLGEGNCGGIAVPVAGISTAEIPFGNQTLTMISVWLVT